MQVFLQFNGDCDLVWLWCDCLAAAHFYKDVIVPDHLDGVRMVYSST
jgi:hypothetical protein